MGSLERNLKMFAAFLLLCVALGCSAETVQIDVIYESLCPDSTRFISQQIPPMYEAIGQHVEIRFRPYGFASTTEVDGSYQFECQHGERECYGNIVQACTVHYTSDQDTLVNLITCMMSRTVRPPHQTTCPGSTWRGSTWPSTGSWRSTDSCSLFVILLTTFRVENSSQ